MNYKGGNAYVSRLMENTPIFGEIKDVYVGEESDAKK